MIFAAALLVCKWLRQAIACVTGRNTPYIIGVARWRHRGRAHTTEKGALKNTLNIFGVDNFLLTLLFKQAEWVAKRH